VADRREERIAARRRDPRWRRPPLRIEMAECINCDACLRHCPPQFGAIFNHGPDVVIVPELCSGCDKCLPACPVDCIYPFADWEAVGCPPAWWDEPGGADDPYRHRARHAALRDPATRG
jgi:electron transport complex protein RnfB